ncbi:MAG: 1-acyl-sn-glycerol-3-phosphate acyltransferase [Candidatus Kerfeldbacteria bacterium]|nr:1-acyl-sn-glycerol-3-phosphate acyltransferase [Candidatus Kerfeldbacteria bacterium]
MQRIRAAAYAVLQYVVIVLTGILTFLIFRVGNRTTVVGRPPRGPQPRMLVISNHQSLVDSFLVGAVLSYPWLYWQPWKLQYQLADGRNFMTHPVMKHVYALLRVIPVGRDANGNRSDSAAFKRSVMLLRQGQMLHVFIEGTRSVSGDLLPPKPQVAGMALLSGATVLPVYFTGMHDVQPYRKLPGDGRATWLRPLFGPTVEWLIHMRFGHRLTIAFGDPIAPSEIDGLVGDYDKAARSAALAAIIMERLRSLKEVVDRQHHGHHPQRLAS